MNEAEYLMKNYGDRGGSHRPRRITPSEISIILLKIRKPNSIIVQLFIQNNEKIFHSFGALTREIFFNTGREISYLRAAM